MIKNILMESRMRQGLWQFGVLLIITLIFVLFVPRYPDVKNIDLRQGEVAEAELQKLNEVNNN